MILYSGADCGALTPVACNDDFDLNGGIYWSQIVYETAPNTTYYLVVDGYNYTDKGDAGVFGEGDFCLNFVNFVVSVDEYTTTQFAMFPNPAKDNFTVRANADVQQVNVFNMIGDLVLTQNFYNNSTVVVNSELAQGIYMVEVKTAFGTTTQKLVVE
jgi:Secretion system C-terminal sorting domain